MSNSISWQKIFDDYGILEHNFENGPFELSAEMIKIACQQFTRTGEKEVRILCKQDHRSDLPQVMKDNGLFLLPVKNGHYVIVKGEGYIDIPEIDSDPIVYEPKLDFILDTSEVGDSEMQHLDYAYATSLIRTFVEDPSLVLTIRGRKYCPEFTFNVGKQEISVKGVQTEVDGGYEGRDKLVLIEAKNSNTSNTLIRQIFYPFKQRKHYTKKEVIPLFFEKRGSSYSIWQYKFEDEQNYNSIKLVKSASFIIKQ